MLKIAVLVSGGGTNLQSIIDAIENAEINAEIKMVIGNKEGIYALERAKAYHIKTFVVDKNSEDNFSDRILKIVDGQIDLIVLAGFLAILDGDILKKFNNKIINIHPSLIPSFCGPGMYGLKVHEAVIKSGVKFSGCTVHFVNDEVDGGAILLQDIVPVYFQDDAKSLQKRVLEKEHKLLPKAIKLIEENKVTIVDERIKIEE